VNKKTQVGVSIFVFFKLSMPNLNPERLLNAINISVLFALSSIQTYKISSKDANFISFLCKIYLKKWVFGRFCYKNLTFIVFMWCLKVRRSYSSVFRNFVIIHSLYSFLTPCIE
jgi:hypothetical protein